MSESPSATPVVPELGGRSAPGLGGMVFSELLAALAAKTPAPGGGAVACAVGALGAAITGMVVSYSVGRKDLAQQRADLEATGRELERLRGLFLELATADEVAYGELNALQKLPEQDERRVRAWPGAVEACVNGPMTCVAAAEELARRCAGLTGRSNPHLRSDLAVGAILAQSAAESGACNVRINLPLLAGESARAEAESKLASTLARTEDHVAAVRKA
ncbi:MAG: cyclodeaminase/cyclohydrolase family protein, partial [Phycisphaerales bacterium]